MKKSINKNQFLFITYGQPGWRGVQVRGIKVAEKFPKNEVIFWNGYDSDFIKKSGFKVETVDLSLIHPDKIKFPRNLKAVIFADFPSNEIFNFAVFLKARKENLPIFILDNIYRKNQNKEGVYSYFSDNSILLLNGPSSFQTTDSNLKVIPPFINYQANGRERNWLVEKYHLNKDDLILFGVGYNELVLQKIEKLHSQVSAKIATTTIIAGVEKLSKPKFFPNKIIHLPFLQEDFAAHLAGADIVVVKFGYLQILEALSLEKPVICVGEGGFLLQSPKYLDESLQKIIIYDPELNNHGTLNFIQRFYQDKTFRKNYLNKLKAIESGKTHGAEVIHQEILKSLKKGKLKSKVDQKVLVFGLNSELDKNIEKIKKISGNKYIIQFIMADITEIVMKKRSDYQLLDKPINSLIMKNEQDMLTHSFRQVLIFSERRYDGFSEIGQWYDVFIDQLTQLIKSADIVYSFPRADYYLKNLKSLAKTYKIIK